MPATTRTVRRAPRWRVFSIAFVALLAPMLLWSLASPLGSVPDEPSHAIRAAAVVRGEVFTGVWSENSSLARADVPAYVAFMHLRTCYAFQPEITADCIGTVAGDPNAIVTTGQSASGNSPLYYAIVGWPTLVFDGDVALYGMRFVNAIIVAALFALMFMQLSLLGRSRWAMIGAAVAITPMVLFLSGSINPNALEAASAGALFATLVGAFRREGTRRVLWERVAIAAIAVVLLVNTRGIALLWVLLILGAALALGDRAVVGRLLRRPAAWVLMAIAAIGSGVAAWGFLHPTLSSTAGAGTGIGAPLAFFNMLTKTFEYADGYVGIFGWVDTPSPAFSVIVWSILIVGLIVAGVVWGNRRSRWTVLGLVATMVIVPAVTQAILAPSLGYIWQGRYMLAILVCLLVASGIALDDQYETRPLSSQARVTLIIGLTLAGVGQVFSFVWALRRYVVGIRGSVKDMFTSPPWQPPLSWEVLALLLAISLTLTAILIYRATTRLPVQEPVSATIAS
jgi:hypothetical protein